LANISVGLSANQLASKSQCWALFSPQTVRATEPSGFKRVLEEPQRSTNASSSKPINCVNTPVGQHPVLVFCFNSKAGQQPVLVFCFNTPAGQHPVLVFQQPGWPATTMLVLLETSLKEPQRSLFKRDP
jgi:hypothetical protein